MDVKRGPESVTHNSVMKSWVRNRCNRLDLHRESEMQITARYGGAYRPMLAKGFRMEEGRYGQECKARLMTIIAVNYVVAAVASALLVVIRSSAFLTPPGWPMLGWGVTNGVLYLIHLLVMMALGLLLAVVVFPTRICSVVGLNVIVAWILFRERLSRRQALGVGVALLIVILTNVG